MAKPVPQRIPSDDCIVPVGGTDYALHEGEWIEIVAGFSLGDLRTVRSARELGVKITAAEGEANEAEIIMDETLAVQDDICLMFSRRIRAWNWTDDSSRPYPQPWDNPAAFADLRAEELAYLLGAVQGVTPASAGKGGSSLATTSSASPPTPTPSSRRDRSPSRA